MMKEAEAFFKRFDGHGCFMWHDDPPHYQQYQRLHIDKATEERWRHELLADILNDVNQTHDLSRAIRVVQGMKRPDDDTYTFLQEALKRWVGEHPEDRAILEKCARDLDRDIFF